MNSNLQLALRISGTKQRRAGFAPLVTVGALAGNEGDNMYRSTMVAERPVYVIKHAEEYILYQLIDRGCKPFDADANGALSIALTISSNAQLAEGKSPFTLLDEVYNKFVETYMEPTSDGRLSFLNTDTDNDIFREIVGKYSLEERRSSYIVMNPTGLTGIVCVSPTDLEDFFRNTQYKEFATFKDIEIGVNCFGQVSLGLDKLQIPLPPTAYDIWVNGKQVGVSMQSPTDSYLATAENTKFYSFESVEFTLSELLNAHMNRISKNGATISLDYQKSRISCDLKKTDIYYDLVYDWTDNVGGAKDKIIEFVKQGIVKLYLGSEDISNSLLTNHNIKASDIRGQKVDIKPQTKDSYSLNAHSYIDGGKHQFKIKITINKKAISGGTNIHHLQRSVRIQNPASTSINSNPNDYHMGDNKPYAERDTQKNEKWFNIKSFLVGILVGAIVVLGVWLAVFQVSKSEKDTMPSTFEDIDTLEVIDKNTPLNQPVNDIAEIPEQLPEADTEAGTTEKVETETKTIAEDAEAKAKAGTQLKAEKKAKESEDLAELIRLINSKELQKCKKCNAWKKLSKSEKIAIEAVLRPDQYTNQVDVQGRRKLDDIKNRQFSFQSLEDVKVVHNDIKKITTDNKN